IALLLPLATVLAAPAQAATHDAHASKQHGTIKLPVPKLVLNEVDYDQPGVDDGEFVEIVNVGSERVRLRHVGLLAVNGPTSTEYRRVQLGGPLGPGRRVVVAAPSVDVPHGVRVIELPLAHDNVQNGSPDALALFDVAHGKLIDALSYEGS